MKTSVMICGLFFLLLCLVTGCNKPESVLRAGDPQDVFIIGTGGGFFFQPAYKLEAGELFKSVLPSLLVGDNHRPDTLEWILLEDPADTDQAIALRAAFPANRLNEDNQRLACSVAIRDDCCRFVKLRDSQGSYLTWFYEDRVYAKNVESYFTQVGQLLRELWE